MIWALMITCAMIGLGAWSEGLHSLASACWVTAMVWFAIGGAIWFTNLTSPVRSGK